MPKSTHSQILNKVNNVVKYVEKQQNKQSSDKEQGKKDQVNKTRLIKETLQEAEQDYARFQKKCIVLREMSDPRNDHKWITLRVKNRYERPTVPLLGTIEKIEIENKIVNIQNLAKYHVSKKIKIVHTLTQITERSQKYENHKLF